VSQECAIQKFASSLARAGFFGLPCLLVRHADGRQRRKFPDRMAIQVHGAKPTASAIGKGIPQVAKRQPPNSACVQPRFSFSTSQICRFDFLASFRIIEYAKGSLAASAILPMSCSNPAIKASSAYRLGKLLFFGQLLCHLCHFPSV